MNRFRSLTVALLAAMLCGSVWAQSQTILTEDDPPYSFLDADKKPTGMAVEIVQEIQRRLKNSDAIEFNPWARAYNRLQKEPNVVLFSMARTAERNELFNWVGPIIDNTWELVAKADSTIQLKTLEDAKKLKKIGVYNQDSRDAYLTQEGFTNLERANNNISGFKMLMGNRVEAFASVDTTLADNLKESGFGLNDVKVVLPFKTVQVFIAMSKTTPVDIVNNWQSAFASMVKDGSYRKIFNMYFPSKKLPGPAITKF